MSPGPGPSRRPASERRAVPITLPQTLPDLLPFLAAVGTMLLGFAGLFAPRLVLGMAKLGPIAGSTAGLSAARTMLGGFPLGAGLALLLFFDQPMMQITLGSAWIFAAFGRLVSILTDDAASLRNTALLLLAVAFAAFCLLPAFGLVSA